MPSKQQNRGGVHGTRSMYVHYKCRCALCVQANRDYQREWHRAHRKGGA